MSTIDDTTGWQLVSLNLVSGSILFHDYVVTNQEMSKRNKEAAMKPQVNQVDPLHQVFHMKLALPSEENLSNVVPHRMKVRSLYRMLISA